MWDQGRQIAIFLSGTLVLSAASTPLRAEPLLCAPPSVTLSNGPYVLRLMEDLVTARRMAPDGGCTTVSGKGAYSGHKLEDCVYTTSGRRRIAEKKGKLEAAPEAEKADWKGHVLTLSPTPAVLARWTEEACEAAGKEVKNCALDICDYVKNQSAAEFPVKGIVIAPDRSLEPKTGTEGDVSFVYRDGVPVVTAKSRALARAPDVSGRSFPGRALSDVEMSEVFAEEYTAVREIKSMARIGGITAECYQRIKDKDARADKTEPDDPVIENGRPSLRWLEVSRDTYLEALRNPYEGYEMFRILARVLKRRSGSTATFDLDCK